MDILNPECRWIENRCYRVLPLRNSLTIDPELEEIYEPTHSTFIDDDRPDDPDLHIIHHGNRFSAIIYVPAPLLGHIKGKFGRMQKLLEQNGSQVKIPLPTHSESGITIIGPTRDIVACTYYTIKEKTVGARLKEDFTHFISFPMNSKAIQQSFLMFKEEVLAKHKGSRNIEKSIFQNPSKLHVTVVPLVLLDERDKQRAEAILTRCKEIILKDFGDTQFVVQVKGVEYMNDDPSEVDVLYAKLQEQDGDTTIQVIADRIMEQFVKGKLAKDQREKVKLHITLMNTRFRDHVENEDEPKERICFDAREILKDYKDYDFGQITINEVHISVRYTESPADGYYIPNCKIKLN